MKPMQVGLLGLGTVGGGTIEVLRRNREEISRRAGRELYCDDLVTDERRRSTGVGHALIAYMEGVVRERACTAFTLDSGTQREQAHKFYFREGMTVTAFHFTMKKKK